MTKDFVDPRLVWALEVNNAGRGRPVLLSAAALLSRTALLLRTGIKFHRSFCMGAGRFEFYR